MNHGETVSVPSPYEGCTALTGEVSVVFFFHLPKMLQKSMPEIILLLLVMCNF